MQNWRTELKVVVAGARHELIPVCSLAPRLPARLQGTFKDLSREIRFSPDLQPRCIPVLRGFLPLRPTCPFSSVLLRFLTLSPPIPSQRIPPSLSPEYFLSSVRSYCRAGTPWGPRIGPLLPELSVNVPFAFPPAFPGQASKKSRKELILGKLSSRWTPRTKRTFCLTSCLLFSCLLANLAIFLFSPLLP